MTMIPWTLTAVFILLVGLVAGAIVLGVHQSGVQRGLPPHARLLETARTSAGLLIWLGVTAELAALGWLHDFTVRPPPLMLLVGCSVILTVSLIRSRFGGMLLEGLPITAVIGLQMFRIPLEWLLWALHQAGVVPVQMTWEGRNPDVLTGLTALGMLVWAWRGRLPAWGILLWNLLGFGLLLNIMGVAMLSAPGPLRIFQNEPANTFITYAPFVWLPTFLVQVALGSHLLVFRHLWQRRQRVRERG